ncbi:MAG: M3 family oligoendopeptidase [Oscillospiraceae bacterium]|nr:M3 family oligoendopeptidase [Oscillospiraceae bacterium]
MKFSEIPYKRPDVDAMIETVSALTADFSAAENAERQLEIFKEFEAVKSRFSTMSCISNIRNSSDSNDPFYIEEQTFYDSCTPKAMQSFTAFEKAVLESSFKAELRKELGDYYFDCMENAQKVFCPEIMDLMAEENALCSRYEAIYASARIEFDGKVCNVSQLSAYRQSPDREIRKAATEAEGRFFDSHKDEIESIYDRLVKNRTQQAKILGFDSYVDMAYVMRNRSYSREDVAKFRSQILEIIVPKTVEYKKQQAEAIGVDDFKFIDNDFMFADGNPKPKYPLPEILNRTQQMFGEMSAETKELIDLMCENELFDIEPRNGKRNAGYCECIEDYGYPFIFFNANGTAADIETLTHECGHALNAYITNREIPYSAVRNAPMEACETHSMSMEFLTTPWHHLFFEEDAAKYSESHTKGAFYFIPYSIIVDYYQELVYSNPDWTPEERNSCWLSLEKQFRPYLDFDNLPFYSRGGGWQQKIHITCMPFYYIDYTVAQTMALQFFSLYLKNPKTAWEKYIKFVKIGGRMNINQHIEHCGLISPFSENGLAEICKPVFEWIDSLK